MQKRVIVTGLGLGVSLGSCQQAAEQATGASAVPARASFREATPAPRPPAAAVPVRPAMPAAPAADSMRALAPFVPRGYQVRYTIAGDLNRDAWPDRVVVLDTAAVVTDSMDYDERERIQQLKRPLLLLLGQPGGRAYTLAARNDHVVECAGCSGAMGGDPLQQVVIRRGYFSVEHYGGSAWRWVSIVTFKYNAADHHWYLHRSGGYSFHAANPDSTMKEDNPRTPRDFGRVRFEAYTGEGE